MLEEIYGDYCPVCTSTVREVGFVNGRLKVECNNCGRQYFQVNAFV